MPWIITGSRSQLFVVGEGPDGVFNEQPDTRRHITPRQLEAA